MGIAEELSLWVPAGVGGEGVMTVPHILFEDIDNIHSSHYRKGIVKCPYCGGNLYQLREEFGCSTCMIWWDFCGNLMIETKDEEDVLVPEGVLLVLYDRKGQDVV